jgi:hypothetical protein
MRLFSLPELSLTAGATKRYSGVAMLAVISADDWQ